MRPVLFIVAWVTLPGHLPAQGLFTATPLKPAFQGVELCELRAATPRLNAGYAARIDLTADGVKFLATPGNGDKPLDTDGLKTSTFLAKHKLQLAVNAAPFCPVLADEGKQHTVVGVQVSGGRLVSTSDRLPALLITKTNEARVAAPPFDFARVENAVGGFQIVLKNGQVVPGSKDIHPRTAAGVGKDGRTLLLLVVDGRQKDYSLGLTTGEVGEWLKALGAEQGINLDGGGTSTLVVADGESAKVVNRPIHAGKPGTERVSASHLGVYAKRLK